MTKEQLRQFIEAVLRIRNSMDDEQALAEATFFPMWHDDKSYAVDDRVRYGEKLYKCLQSHTAQADWTPDVAVSLWVRVDDPAIEWPDWRQPTGAQDAYAKGSKVSHNDKHWVSTADNNVWEPGVYGWDEA